MVFSRSETMLRRFWNSNDGNYALIFAIALVPIMAAVAGTVDYVSTANGASKVQESLDATALAIGAKYSSGMSPSEVQQIGSDFFAANIRKSGIGYNDDDGTGTTANDKVVDFNATATPDGNDISIVTSGKLMHAGFIVGTSSIWQAKRKAYVKFKPGQPACLLALDPHASTAVKVWGSTQVKLNGCVISANSDASDAVSRGGSAQLKAKCVSTVGATSGLSTSTMLDCGNPLEKQYPSLDPLYGVLPPTNFTSCSSLPNGKNKNLTPGKWCNKTWSGTITLAPGSYVLNGGSIQLGGNGSLTGSGVTIFLTNGANLSLNANETINLSPPTSGTYAGITIYQEKANTNELKINGGLSSKLTGFIYAPGAPIFYAGNSAMTGSGDCVRVVGNTVEMTGNSNVSANCAGQLGNRDMYAGRTILLVK